MKNGFSTLNRLLGKKSKSNTNLSKSTANLSVAASATNIDDSSQMQQNRITPLPVATSNAFEQTFRITVLLPKDQLYVTRLGARVLLQTLLEMVCENKQMDEDKYEFRHPADPSQIFSLDLTIGAVGLSEIRLCHKSEAYDTFNADEIIKLHRTTAGRDSVSSSEFSSRNSKHTIKTPSPYSSSNSLNSMDSTSMNSSYRQQSTPKTFAQPSGPPVAPTRKKRMAPRPPSQNSIPEKSDSSPVPITKPSSPVKRIEPKVNGLQPIPRKDFHASSPNLGHTTELTVLNTNDFHKSNLSVDCNGNTKGSPNNNKNSVEQNGFHTDTNGGVVLKRPTSLHTLNQMDADASAKCDDEIAVKNARNSFSSVQNLSNIDSPDLPEPSPRKKLVKGKKAAPAPPPRSLQSPAATIQESPPTAEDEEPPPTPTTLQPPIPVALPRSSAGRSTPEPQPLEQLEINMQNVSKTMLNRSPTPEPRSLSQNGDRTPDDGSDTQSKQADSGIGEALPPSPMPSPVQNSPTQCKSPFESSSDDDEMIKVYNLKLGKTIVKTLADHKTFEDLTVLSTDESEVTDQTRTPAETCSIKSEATSWSNFTIPAPPNFADTSEADREKLPDTPITPIIKERPALDFTSLTLEQTMISPSESPEPPLTKVKAEEKRLSNSDIEDGFKGKQEENQIHHTVTTEIKLMVKDDNSSQAITEKDTTMRNEDEPKDQQKEGVIIEKQPITPHTPSITDPDGIGEQEAKVINEMDTIINSIETIIKQKPLFTTLDRLGVPEEPDEDEEDLKGNKIYKKRSSITLSTNILKHRRSVTRSDSFHSTRQQQVEETAVRNENGLPTRSSSFLSLAKFGSENQQSPPAEENLNCRRSSSELSIGESPSLQSVQVMKSILNSRKNSLTSQSSTEEQKTQSVSNGNSNHSSTKPQPLPKSKILRTEVSKASDEKVYRYSGPPSINFSTWSERPKVQVSIKNEGDYIFGGKTGGHNATTTATVNLVQQRNYRNSTPDPITAANRLPFVRSVEYKKTTATTMAPLKETNSRFLIGKEPVAPLSTPQPQPQSQTASPPTTMPKPKFILGGRMSNPAPVVRGFAQTTTPAPQSISSSTLPRSHGHSTSSLLRSTSVTQADVKPKPNVEPTQPLFGQGGLRKTGLKEKILGNQENDAPKPAPTILTTPESAKIELKITKTYIPDEKSQKRVPYLTTSPLKPTLKPTVTSPVTPSAPPPPPPIIRAVVTKQNSAVSPTSLSIDPRDQLLSAIRNFKRDELKRT